MMKNPEIYIGLTEVNIAESIPWARATITPSTIETAVVLPVEKITRSDDNGHVTVSC
jgi:hypothetical protein